VLGVVQEKTTMQMFICKRGGILGQSLATFPSILVEDKRKKDEFLTLIHHFKGVLRCLIQIKNKKYLLLNQTKLIF
jgi:hypothetical protein